MTPFHSKEQVIFRWLLVYRAAFVDFWSEQSFSDLDQRQ